MFRQIILLISIVVATNALSFSFTQGLRGDDDVRLLSGTFRGLAPSGSTTVVLSLRFIPNINNIMTYATYNILEVFIFNICFASYKNKIN